MRCLTLYAPKENLIEFFLCQILLLAEKTINENGINYWVEGSNGTFVGPNTADRIEYHRHIDEQAVLNNF